MLEGMIYRHVPDVHAKRWFLPHAPAKLIYETVLHDCGVRRDRMYLEVFPRFGDVVSACVPVGIALAQQQGVLERGDDIVLVPVSAGMTAAVVQTTF
jgi:3-oxoacyl-[acyl-carrier-protein] synthase III